MEISYDDVDPSLDKIRKDVDNKRRGRGNTFRFEDPSDVARHRGEEIITWGGPRSDDREIPNLTSRNRWRIFDYRTSNVPFIRQRPKMRLPNKKQIQYRLKVTTYCSPWRRSQFRCDPTFECCCGRVHDLWFTDYASGKPDFVRYSSFVPEFAVLTESEIVDVLKVDIPPAPEPSEALSDEQKISKRYLQHLIRKYEVRLAEYERKTRKASSSGRSSLQTSLEDVNATDYSLMQSVDIILPPERLWIVIFTETWKTDRGMSHWAATRMGSKLDKHGIPFIIIDVPRTSYPTYTGFYGQRFEHRYDKSERMDRARAPAKRNKKGHNVRKNQVWDETLVLEAE